MNANTPEKLTVSTDKQPGAVLSYGDKLRVANRDAVHAVIALGVVVLVWLACGFGLSGVDVQVFHVPLWVIGGLLGTWIAAIAASIVLARSFKDFALEEAEDEKASAVACTAGGREGTGVSEVPEGQENSIEPKCPAAPESPAAPEGAAGRERWASPAAPDSPAALGRATGPAKPHRPPRTQGEPHA